LRREAFDDGWTEADPEPQQVATTLQAEKARTILTRNDSPDIGFDRSINPYRGCEHGCIYCYARPAHAYMGLSPGIDFETKLFFKPDAAQLLEKELSKPGYKPALVHIGGNTDPYQPAERKLGITRAVLEVLDRFNHPTSIITKSALIARDADILARMAEKQILRASMSVTTLDRKLARAMEPRASTPERRLWAVKQLTSVGVPVGVNFAPCIPGLNDHEMEAVLAKAAEAGADGAGYITLRLPLEIKDLFQQWLEAERPDRAKRVMSLVRQMRGGRDYDSQWGSRMTGHGPVADLMRTRFRRACKALGLNGERRPMRLDLFAVPTKPKAQLDLFG
jgi:DNA repair photolyase